MPSAFIVLSAEDNVGVAIKHIARGSDVAAGDLRLTALDENSGAVLVIGHNPGLHEFALALAAREGGAYRALAQGKFPTTVRAMSTQSNPPAGICGKDTRMMR